MFVLAKLTDGVRVHAVLPDVVTFNVLDSMDPEGARGSYHADWPATAVRPRLQWESERRSETAFRRCEAPTLDQATHPPAQAGH